MASIDTLLTTLTTSLAEADERVRDIEGLPGSVKLQRRRVEHISLVVASADSQLVPDDAASALEVRLETWITALSRDATTPQLAESIAASGAALSALPPYGTATPAPTTIAPFIDAIERTSSSAARFEAEMTSLDARVDQTLKRIETAEIQVQKSVELREAELQQKVDDKVADFELKSVAIESQMTDSLSLARQQHETLRDEQKRLFEEDLEEAENVTEAAREGDTLKAAELLTAQKSAGDNAIETLERQLTEAADLMGAIGRTGQSVAYAEDAEVEGKQARKWRNYTIWFAAGAAAVLLISVLLRPIAGWLNLSDIAAVDDYRSLFSRALLSGALGGLAAYSSRQAAMHRRASRKARNRELALASIGGYLQPLSKEKQEQVLEAFAFLFFAQADEESSTDPQGDSPVMGAQLFKLLQQLGGTDR